MGSCTLQEWAVGVLHGALSSCLSWIESLRVVPRDVRMLPRSYVCVYVYIYVAHRYVNTYDIWIYIYTYEYICTPINMHKYSAIHTCTYTNTYAVAQTHQHSAKSQCAALAMYMCSACSRDICMLKVTNESCHADLWVVSQIRMSRAQRHVRVTHVWVMEPISCHPPMSHVKHQWVMSHTNESCHAHINASCCTDHWVTYSAMYAIVITASLYECCQAHEQVISHVWMSHVTHVAESCYTHRWVTYSRHVHNCPHGISMYECRHTHCVYVATPMDKSHHTHEWATSHLYTSHGHTWMSHFTLINESCHTSQRVMPHIWTSHVTRINEHTYERVMSHECVMSHLWKRSSWASTNTSQSVCCKGVYAIACTRTPLLRTSCLYQTALFQGSPACVRISMPSPDKEHVSHDSFTCVTWCVTWLLHKCHLT